MKNYEEMAKCVLEARDRYINKKKIRQAKIKKYTPVIFNFCFAALLGFGVWHHMSGLPHITYQPDIMETNTEQTEQSTETNMTEQSSEKHTEHNTTEQQVTRGNTTANSETHQEQQKTESSSDVETHVMTDPIVIEPVITEPKTLLPTEPSVKQPTTTEIPFTSVPDEEPNINSNPLHWNEMTINQQYNMAEFGEPLSYYMTAEKEASFDEIGDFICLAYMSGYDFYSDTYYHCKAEAYRLKSDNSLIAIKFDSDQRFYLYYLMPTEQSSTAKKT